MNDRDKIALKLYDLGTDRREDWWLRYADALLAPGGPVAEIVEERMSAARAGGDDDV